MRKITVLFIVFVNFNKSTDHNKFIILLHNTMKHPEMLNDDKKMPERSENRCEL